MYPTQLSYLQPAPLQYTYPNYCMLPPVYNNMMATNPNTVLPTTTTQEESRDTRDNVTSSSLSTVPDTNISVGEVGSEACEDRTEYMEELSRERESLEQNDAGHARRLLDRGEERRGEESLTSHVLTFRDITPPVWSEPGPHQLRGADGGRVQREAHQTGGEGDCSRKGASQGKQIKISANKISSFFVFSNVS